MRHVRETVGAVGGPADHEASLQGADAVLPGQRCGCRIPMRRHDGCLALLTFIAAVTASGFRDGRKCDNAERAEI